MSRRGLAMAAAAALVVVGLAACHRKAPPPKASAQAAEPAPPTESVVLFFVDLEGRLQREPRELPELPSAAPARIRLLLDELMLGSHQGLASPFPWSTSVRTVFVDKQGTAWVDLAPGPPAGVVTGTDMEAALAYATVNTVAANCHGIERVQLLFDGKQVDTLGHLDLSRPLRPQAGLVAP